VGVGTPDQQPRFQGASHPLRPQGLHHEATRVRPCPHGQDLRPHAAQLAPTPWARLTDRSHRSRAPCMLAPYHFSIQQSEVVPRRAEAQRSVEASRTVDGRTCSRCTPPFHQQGSVETVSRLMGGSLPKRGSPAIQSVRISTDRKGGLATLVVVVVVVVVSGGGGRWWFWWWWWWW
jgi:hypothetical protein